MKILFGIENYNAHFFQHRGLGQVFSACGFEVVMWDIYKKPTFDAFDELNPDIFIGQSYNINEYIVQAIKERPAMQVLMKAGDWGYYTSNIDLSKYPILAASESERNAVFNLREKYGKPDALFVHYHPDYLEKTHGGWMAHDVPVISYMNAADVFDYHGGEYNPAFETDLAFVGGYWPYKAQVLDKWLLPLCSSDYNIKIFGNSAWPTNRYCGPIPTEFVKHVFASTKIAPNLSEPHSQDFGFDPIERPFKLLANGCFVISDYVESLEKMFSNDEIVFAKTPEDFHKYVDHFLKFPDERRATQLRGYQEVLKNHTYFDRARDILHFLGRHSEAEFVMYKKHEVLRRMTQ